MKKVQLINGLALTYEDSEEKKSEKILTFIKDKSFLFADFDDVNNSKTININEFENFVKTIVKQIVEADSVKKDTESEDFLPAFYLAYLILQNNKENDTLIKFLSNISKDLLLFLVSIKYYNYGIDNGECYFDKNEQIWKIYLTSDSTIRTFVTFVHEFSHYVSLSKNKNNNFSLLEFPSIYFENIAAEFLKNSGYEKEIVDEVLNVRNTSNINLYWNQILQLKDIIEYKKYGTFSIEKRIEFYKNWIKSMNNFKNNMVQILKDAKIDDIPSSLLTIEEHDPVEMAYEELEEKITSFVQSGVLILNGYQYLIGS